ncbi:hypothetical protein G7B40_016120 [Aetokthonos hydrillicola Thurmond2011]|jgi:predicted membrane chloride channel (bestrophin family)|uniref:Uncharacterized protein n=1 Tax=Aetokthonos hydrillicola Thurmond2011 TaxID=2712845 RepID=A0AAP5I987_9CYAN|nr:bestrophin family ion channel [Aetokthonos hydrillicola]MBO3458709.1 hypothetical protein [Aetokthonos hydrillicola CCALA 1050]MBW4585459.1 hypothetical protein [Aetokthonos hydrillicola CCALA 1050]MDR9896079.1 hypothetical protein [Aetokthonos hydrillicola Thurmond2011]
MNFERNNWFKLALNFKISVIRDIKNQVLLSIGLEIEDPFGCDPNDIPLDKLCKRLLSNIEELIASQANLDIATTPKRGD